MLFEFLNRISRTTRANTKEKSNHEYYTPDPPHCARPLLPDR